MNMVGSKSMFILLLKVRTNGRSWWKEVDQTLYQSLEEICFILTATTPDSTYSTNLLLIQG